MCDIFRGGGVKYVNKLYILYKNKFNSFVLATFVNK